MTRARVRELVYQTMGYCFAAAIGAKLAAPSKSVLCIAGDGSLMMQLGEVATALANGLNIIVVIFNNGYLNATISKGYTWANDILGFCLLLVVFLDGAKRIPVAHQPERSSSEEILRHRKLDLPADR